MWLLVKQITVVIQNSIKQRVGVATNLDLVGTILLPSAATP